MYSITLIQKCASGLRKNFAKKHPSFSKKESNKMNVYKYLVRGLDGQNIVIADIY